MLKREVVLDPSVSNGEDNISINRQQKKADKIQWPEAKDRLIQTIN